MAMKPLYAGLITAAAIVGAILICVGCRRCYRTRDYDEGKARRYIPGSKAASRSTPSRRWRRRESSSQHAAAATHRSKDRAQASRTRKTRSSTNDTTTTERRARRVRSSSIHVFIRTGERGTITTRLPRGAGACGRRPTAPHAQYTPGAGRGSSGAGGRRGAAPTARPAPSPF